MTVQCIWITLVISTIPYEAYDFAKALLENDEMLLSYLFDSDSCVATGNDNSDEEVFEDEHAKWVYRKGN